MAKDLPERPDYDPNEGLFNQSPGFYESMLKDHKNTSPIVRGVIRGNMNSPEYAINQQIKAYKDQTAITQKALEETRAATEVEKRRIQEKQIRSLRGQFRPSGGFLNNQSLGGDSNLPNKLGTA